MQNKTQDGKTVNILNSGAAVIKGGSVVVFGSRIVIPIADIPVGEFGACATEGVYEIPAVTTTAFAQGDVLYWDNTAKKLTKTSTDNTRAGVSWDDKGQASAVAFVCIDK
ncbi:DUF2190 family protein [Seleniivibrio woodruffii]|uniref:DUF2190 family protein n=1 Tax=Seleniivibrio woodruffii TaxID=1078050 RepID=UPI002409866D|nr:DUF2190 family protein [Seleniivibrio woodruffii]